MNKKLKPEQITVLVDNREQKPLRLDPLRSEPGTLPTGDYAIKCMPDLLCIERKELGDLLTCLGTERERFEREMQRILAYPVRALVVEAEWSQIELKSYRSQIHPNAVMGSLMGLIARGIPVIMIGDHHRASKWVARMIFLAAQRRWHENYHLMESLMREPGQEG